MATRKTDARGERKYSAVELVRAAREWLVTYDRHPRSDDWDKGSFTNQPKYAAELFRFFWERPCAATGEGHFPGNRAVFAYFNTWAEFVEVAFGCS